MRYFPFPWDCKLRFKAKGKDVPVTIYNLLTTGSQRVKP